MPPVNYYQVPMSLPFGNQTQFLGQQMFYPTPQMAPTPFENQFFQMPFFPQEQPEEVEEVEEEEEEPDVTQAPEEPKQITFQPEIQ